MEVSRLSYPVDSAAARPGRGKDMSGGGMRFSGPVPYEPRARLTVTLSIPGFRRFRGEAQDGDAADPAISAVAEVVWCREAQDGQGFDVGIRFVDISAEDYRALKRYLSGAANPDAA